MSVNGSIAVAECDACQADNMNSLQSINSLMHEIRSWDIPRRSAPWLDCWSPQLVTETSQPEQYVTCWQCHHYIVDSCGSSSSWMRSKQELCCTTALTRELCMKQAHIRHVWSHEVSVPLVSLTKYGSELAAACSFTRLFDPSWWLNTISKMLCSCHDVVV